MSKRVLSALLFSGVASLSLAIVGCGESTKTSDKMEGKAPADKMDGKMDAMEGKMEDKMSTDKMDSKMDDKMETDKMETK